MFIAAKTIRLEQKAERNIEIVKQINVFFLQERRGKAIQFVSEHLCTLIAVPPVNRLRASPVPRLQVLFRLIASCDVPHFH